MLPRRSAWGLAILLAPLLCIPLPVQADWYRLGSRADAEVHADLPTAGGNESSSDGNEQLKSVPVRFNYNIPRKHERVRYESEVVSYVIDCARGQVRAGARELYAERQGIGELVASIDGPEVESASFEVPAAGTVEARLLSMVCAARQRAVVASEPASTSSGEEARRVFESASKSVALIGTDAGRQGSAVAIHLGDEGYVEFATNCHVLAGAKKFVVKQRDTTAIGVFVAGNPELDACMFKARLPASIATLRPTKDTRVGERVYAIGAPSGMELTLSDGLLSGKRISDGESALYLQTSAPISPGSSGGGLFDSAGRLLGITTFRLDRGSALNFAISADAFTAMKSVATVRSLVGIPARESAERTQGKSP